MIHLIIKDNSIYGKNHFDDIPGIKRAVADKTLLQLSEEGVFVYPRIFDETEDLDEDQIILQSKGNIYVSGNVMGFLGCGDERLTIESRFGENEHDYLFQYMLERVLEFPNVLNLETQSKPDDRMFRLLMFMFPPFLTAALRKGLFKTYVVHQHNDSDIKGEIDIDRHIRQNLPFVGRIAYNQREYSYNNFMLQLVRHTIEYIKQYPYAKYLLSKVKDEVKLIVSATPDYELKERQRIVEENKKHIIRHAFYHEYRALQRLCILILQNERHRIGIGEHRTFGILFDGAWLWEEYINTIISDLFYHPENKKHLGGQWLFSNNSGRIYPDFIGKTTEDMIVADAKYKPIKNIGNKDYHQMLSYMLRFDSKKGLFLYPCDTDETDICLAVNSGSTYEKNVSAREDVFVIKHGLRIAKASSYDEFKELQTENEIEFKNSIN